jgi:hypothetical protein
VPRYTNALPRRDLRERESCCRGLTGSNPLRFGGFGSRRASPDHAGQAEKQRRHHHCRRSAIGVLYSLFWAFWSLLASAASRSYARLEP